MSYLLLLILIINLFSFSTFSVKLSYSEYIKQREILVSQERQDKFSSSITLLPPEIKVEYMLSTYREEFLKTNDIRKNFLLIKSEIEKSPLLSIFREIPKGSLLHVHWDSCYSYEDLAYKYSYYPNCYFYYPVDSSKNDNGHPFGSLHFFANDQTAQQNDVNWVPISWAREQWPSPEIFDDELYENLTLQYEEIEPYSWPWSPFEDIFGRTGGAIPYVEVLSDYYLSFFESLDKENIIHLEIRWIPFQMFDLNGTLTVEESVDWMYNFWKSYLVSHPNSNLTLSLIWSGIRSNNRTYIKNDIELAISIIKKYPSFVVGYDLVGEEDPGHTLEYFSKVLVEELSEYSELKYFFHAGESTNPSNQNLYDAILLNTSRIGHGILLYQHPELIERVKSNGIGIEVCPISNQVLGYVWNPQTHPAGSLLRNGVPITLNPDDPALFGYSSVAYDWFQAYVSWNLTLSDLKQLAINSIEYSSLSDDIKISQLNYWNTQWNLWISSFFDN